MCIETLIIYCNVKICNFVADLWMIHIMYYKLNEQTREEIERMAELINTTYQGCNITIGLTGLPITITGEVCGAAATAANADNLVTLKLKDGKIVNVAGALIAFFF